MFIGGAAGAAVVMAILRRWPGQSARAAVTVVASFLLGALSASVSHSWGVVAPIGFGALGTASSFLLVLDDRLRPPATLSDVRLLLRRVTGRLAVTALLAVTFALTGYLSVAVGVVLYHKLLAP